MLDHPETIVAIGLQIIARQHFAQMLRTFRSTVSVGEKTR
jgi:hypothetical protein